MGLFGTRRQPPMVAEPRDIPALFPDFYLGILTATGKPTTSGNVVDLVDRVARMIGAGSALPYFEQAHDDAASRRFLAKFNSTEGDGESELRKPDLMIDFLWEWDPTCHHAVRRAVANVYDLLTGPDSFLWSCGDKIPAWDGLDQQNE
jgi:hypothetical protein